MVLTYRIRRIIHVGKLLQSPLCSSFHSSGIQLKPVDPVYRLVPKFSERIAIQDAVGDHTYSELERRSSVLAEKIKKAGVAKGSRIALLAPSSSQYVVGQWGIWKSGCVVVPLCKSHPLDMLRYYVNDSGADLIVATDCLIDNIQPLENQVLTIGNESADSVSSFEDQKSVVDSEDSAMILYTSGTTGPPKGVVLTHGNLLNQAGCLISAWKWRETDKILHVLPLHHTHGIVNCLLCPLSVGASVVMLEAFKPELVWQILMQQHSSKVNVFMAVPTIYAKLLEYFDGSSLKQEAVIDACKSIRLMVSGSAALPTPVLERWREATGHTLLERYGMTEIGMALSNPLEGERVPGAVGSPLPGVSARIVRWSEDQSYSILAEGTHDSVSTSNSEEGELLVRGPNVFKEYHNRPEATSKEFTEDGWFKTGDTCKVENGVFKILGRTSVDIIKSGGYKISALDIERILLTHPLVQDVAVVGVTDPTWGQRVAAVLVPTQPQHAEAISKDLIREWCKEKMAKYWIPTEVKVLAEMPRNTMGKVNKKQLTAQVFP